MDDHINPVESIFLEATGGDEVLSIESEWKKLKHSLVKLGLVMEEDNQCRFQDLWDKHQIVAKGRSNNENSGKIIQPSACVTLELIENLAFQLYPVKEEIDTAIQYFFSSATKQVNYFQDLLESWDVDRLNMKQAVHLADELRFVNSKLASCIQTAEKEYTLLGLLFAAESVRNCHRVISTDYNNIRIRSKTNAFVWQQENTAIVNNATRRLTVSDVVFGGDGAALINRQKTDGQFYVNTSHAMHSGDAPLPIDIWGVCQGYYNSPRPGMGLYKAMATTRRNLGAVSVQALVVTSTALPYRELKAVQQCYHAHKQLAAASSVCSALGTVDNIVEMTYMYEYVKVKSLDQILKSMREREYQLDEKSLVFQHVANEALRCFARLQKQGTFGVEERLSSKNILVGECRKYIRLGGIKAEAEAEMHTLTCSKLANIFIPAVQDLAIAVTRWGPDISAKSEQQAIAALNERDLKLGEDFADIIEEVRQKKNDVLLRCASPHYGMLGLNQSRSELLDDDNVEIDMEDVFQGNKIELNVSQTATLHLDSQSDHPQDHHWYVQLIQGRHHHLGLASENPSILPEIIRIEKNSNIVPMESGPVQPGRAVLKLRAVREGNVELQCFCNPTVGCMASQERKSIAVYVTVRSKSVSTGLRMLLQCCKERRYIKDHATGAASVTLTDLLCHGGIEPILPSNFGALISEFDLYTA